MTDARAPMFEESRPSLISTEIIVVGAGPAGSMVAKTAAEHGARVVLLEEHRTPGLPVSCAEALGVDTLTEAGIDHGSSVINLDVERANVYTPNGKCVTISNKRSKAYMINRDVFDALLAENAVKAGAIIKVDTRVHSLIKKDGTIIGVEALTYVPDQDKTLPIRFFGKIIIGADGHASTVRQKAFKTGYFKDVGVCAQYTLSGLNIKEPKTVDFWIGKHYAPGGYVWLFPKSKTVANVGISINPKLSTKSAVEYLNEFIENQPRFLGSKIIRKTGGILPITGTLPDIVGDGVMLVGDAAGQLIPMTGAGIETAIHAGKIAGRVAAQAVIKKDFSKQNLMEYPILFNERWGKIIEDSKKMLTLYNDLTDDELNKLSEIITPDQVQELANGENLIKNLFFLALKAPRLTFKFLTIL